MPIPHYQLDYLNHHYHTVAQDSPYTSLHRLHNKHRNINLFPIGFASRLYLRGRLTLGRRPLPRKPYIFGGQDSHLPFRYSCLHSYFCYLQYTSQYTFSGLQNIRLPLAYSCKPIVSVHCLAPLYYRRTATRPVSYYALFQGMAASKPTSWLFLPPHFLFHLAMFRDLN